MPKSVTYVLNLLCYLCPEPAPKKSGRLITRRAVLAVAAALNAFGVALMIRPPISDSRLPRRSLLSRHSSAKADGEAKPTLRLPSVAAVYDRRNLPAGQSPSRYFPNPAYSLRCLNQLGRLFPRRMPDNVTEELVAMLLSASRGLPLNSSALFDLVLA